MSGRRRGTGNGTRSDALKLLDEAHDASPPIGMDPVTQEQNEEIALGIEPQGGARVAAVSVGASR